MVELLKKMVFGIVIGSALTLTTSVFADSIKEYILTKIEYPIMVNGSEFKSNELPALNYQGNTYLPLKAIADALGKPIKWNDDLKRVEIGVAPSPTPSPELTPEQRAEQTKQLLNSKVQKLYDEYKAKGIELINLSKFESFMGSRMNYFVEKGDNNSKNYSFSNGSTLQSDGKTNIPYIGYQGTKYDFKYGVEVITPPDDIPGYVATAFVDLSFLKKFVSQNIIDEYKNAVDNQAWGTWWGTY
jgi:hypothetical protein